METDTVAPPKFILVRPNRITDATGNIVATLRRRPLYIKREGYAATKLNKYAYLEITDMWLRDIYAAYVYYGDIVWQQKCIKDSWFIGRINECHPMSECFYHNDDCDVSSSNSDSDEYYNSEDWNF